MPVSGGGGGGGGGDGIDPAVVTAKGDLIVATASGTVDNLAAGTDGFVLSANSAMATGLEWIEAAEGGGGGLPDEYVRLAIQTSFIGEIIGGSIYFPLRELPADNWGMQHRMFIPIRSGDDFAGFSIITNILNIELTDYNIQITPLADSNGVIDADASTTYTLTVSGLPIEGIETPVNGTDHSVWAFGLNLAFPDETGDIYTVADGFPTFTSSAFYWMVLTVTFQTIGA